MGISVGDDDNNNASDNKAAQPAASTPATQPKTDSSSNQQQQTQGNQTNTGASNNQSNTSFNNQNQNQGTRQMNTEATISSRNSYGFSRAAGTQDMRTIVEVIDKIAETENEQPVKFSFIGLDGEKEGLLISALVVTATLKNAGNAQKFVAHHTLLLGGTARGVNVVEQKVNLGNQTVSYERLVVTADALDGTLRARVNDAVGRQFPGYTMIDADATVVPANVDLKAEVAVRNIIANATTAASTLLSSIVSSDAWVITEENAKRNFQVEVKNSWNHFQDLAGQPVRGDVVLEMGMLTGKDQNQNNPTGEFQYNAAQARRLMTQMTGYIDVVMTPSSGLNTLGGLNGGVSGVATSAEALKVFTPRFVITNVDAPEEAPELPILLQGFATAQVLADDARWISALIQQHKNGAAHAKDGVNIRDLSAIGLEAPTVLPLGYMGGEVPKAQRLLLNSAMAGDAALAAAINTYFNQDLLLISMDVPECGPSSWMVSPFAASARGDQNATRDIFEAADLLTRNHFSSIYKGLNNGTMPAPFFNDNMYVNLGFYNSAEGQRDIRDGDYLAVLNATGDAELNTINDWANLQANSEVDPMFRLTETRRLQGDLFESMTITGRAVRITAHPNFPLALAMAIREAGLIYDAKFNNAAAQTTSRMVPTYMRNLPTHMGTSGGFVTGGVRRTGAQGTGFNSFGRYSHNNNRSNAQPGSGSF